MSNITGDGDESFSSENNTGGGRELAPFPSAANSNSSSSASMSTQPPQPPVKKKRNLPGTPDPTAEVIALSPTTLTATNRFVCEICNKGFQRDQNLQLHRRGHNLPWKLKQRAAAEVRKRVYVCPEASCVHHSPARALGDLTGIKKHFCRKHGEKKWKCDKCSKKYAVQSDWKAHSKTCGTREYKCDCGTIFSRRDSFITHRAFCDALAEENHKAGQQQGPGLLSSSNLSEFMIPITSGVGASSISISDFNHHHHLDSTLESLTMAGAVGGLGFDTPVPMPTAPAHMSATALLQKAAQMGAATASGPVGGSGGGNGRVTAVMAGPDIRSYAPGGYGDGGGYHSSSVSQQFFEGSATAAAAAMFRHSSVAGVLFDGGFLNGLEPERSSDGMYGGRGSSTGGAAGGLGWGSSHGRYGGGSGPGSGDTTTVDFLGVGGARPPPPPSLSGGTTAHRQQFQQRQLSRGEGGMEKTMCGDVGTDLS